MNNNTQQGRIEIDSKVIRKIGKEFGYGVTIGACKAMLVSYICYGVASIALKYVNKKMKIEEKPKKETTAEEQSPSFYI